MLKNPNILPRQARDEQVEHRKRLEKDTFLHQATERLQSTSRGRKSARSTFEASELWTQISRICWRTETLALRHAWCCRGTPRVVWRRTCMQRPDLYIKTNILPRQARDTHRGKLKNRCRKLKNRYLHADYVRTLLPSTLKDYAAVPGQHK